MVYSTCSVTVEEDEAVINYALNHRYVKIVDSGVAIGTPGVTAYKKYRFPPSMKLARRIFPHGHNMDGFCFCKLKKYAKGHKKTVAEGEKEVKPAKETIPKTVVENSEKKKSKKEKKKNKKKAKNDHKILSTKTIENEEVPNDDYVEEINDDYDNEEIKDDYDDIVNSEENDKNRSEERRVGKE